MSSFTTELKVRPLPDGKLWEVLEGFCYRTVIDGKDYTITVPAGFVTDFASTPRAIWWLYPPWGKYGKAAVVHDFLYARQLWSRSICDREFQKAMAVLGVDSETQRIMYTAVRLCGWYDWWRKSKRAAAARESGAYIETLAKDGGSIVRV